MSESEENSSLEIIEASSGLNSLRRFPKRRFTKGDESTKTEIIKESEIPIEEEIIKRELTSITESRDIGVVLKRLKEQVELGIDSAPKEFLVFDNLEDALGEDLSRALEAPLDGDNSEIDPVEQTIKIPEKRFRQDIDAYYSITESNKKLFGDESNVELINKSGELLVVTDQNISDRLRVIQVIDASHKMTKEYEESLETTRYVSVSNKKETYAVLNNLFIQDRVTGKVFDARSLLPADWELRLKQDSNNLQGFSQSFEDKVVSFENITSPHLLIGLFHEFGHGMFTFNDDPESFKRANELWVRSRMTIGGTSSISQEVLDETKELLVKNERGASAHAFQIIRSLKSKGIDLGLTASDISEMVNKQLSGYEEGFPSDKSHFIRASKIDNIAQSSID